MIGKKLLVADDSLTIQKVIRLALQNEGYEIQTVSDGNDAIQQIAVFRPDIVLIDVALPGKSAFDVKAAVEGGSEFAPTHFIVMSSAYEKVDEQHIESAQFAGRLTKPFDPAHLRKVLNETLEQNPPPEKLSEEPTLGNFAPPLPPLPSEPPVSELPHISDDVWGNEDELNMPPPPPEMPPGLADFSPPPPPLASPNLPPLPPSFSGGEQESDIKHLTESTIRMSGLDDFQWSVNEPSLKPPASLAEPADSGFSLEPSDEISNNSGAHTIDLNAPEESATAIGISREEMEEMIKQQVKAAVDEALRNFTKENLPNMAEKLLKAEIHRMLSEHP